MTTRERILLAAEELIAANGISVSLRSIAARADANSAAIHYHFGSKEELIKAALERRRDEIARRRSELLASVGDVNPPPLRSAVEALVRPLAEWTEAQGSRYVQFLAAIRRGGEPWQALLAEAFAPYSTDVWTMIDHALPDLDPGLREFRRAAVAMLLLEVLGDRGAAAIPPEWTHADVGDALVDATIGLLTASSDAPMRSLKTHIPTATTRSPAAQAQSAS